MDRDVVDIPEVFRRAFEGEEWGEGDGDEGGRGNGGRRGRPWWINRWVWLSALFLLVLLSFNWIVTTVTNWLWFSALGYQRVWLTLWAYRAAAFAVFFAIAAAVLLIAWRTAFNSAKRAAGRSRLRLLELPGMSWLVTGAALFVAFIFAGAGSTQWERFLLYLNRSPSGIDDPVFGLDLSFYLFELPVFRFLQSWFTPLIILVLLGVVGLHLLDRWAGWRQRRWWAGNVSTLRRQTAVLVALIALLLAVGNWLGIYELLYSPRGVAFGASYTDLNATLPGLYAQIVLLILLAVAAAANIFRQALRPALAAGALWLLAVIIAGNVYPSILQRYAVEPNELARERPYIEHNIELTRLAFGLERIDVRPFSDVQELSRQDLEEHEATLQNVRLWDYRPLQQTYAQLQELRPYYEFSSVDIDRYEIEGETRQVMLAGRELNKQNLPSQSWVNQRLIFTHGYGLVMNPVDQVTPEGRPEFFIQDLPPRSSVSLEVDRPEIYYGELMNDIVLVNSRQEEFDYPIGAENAQSRYRGQGGVQLSNFWRRLAFAIRFGEANLMLSQDITPETRIMINRQIRDRVQRITPFLTFDNDPYLVWVDGRLVWMVDAYTLSRNFPYSTPTEQGFNYIRNAAKVTIDAYDGRVTYYLAAPDDPLTLAYAQAFPSLFRPLDEMPSSLRLHIRYPEGLFIVQTRQYLKYHMSDVQVFYNQEDLWEIPLELFDENQQPVEPYYVILSLPGEDEPEFLLIQPYTPAGKNNMVAWFAARNDEPHYGELIAYVLPKQELIFGPIQVEARIDQDPQISQQISLWNQRGSRVIRGNLIVIPMNDSFLYVEPLYLLAQTSELPELKRVIVASGDRVAMRETLEEALTALTGAGPSVAELVTEPPVSGGVDAPSEPEEAVSAPPSGTAFEELVRSANAHFEAAEAAQRSGDWATYGRELEALRQDLEQLDVLANE